MMGFGWIAAAARRLRREYRVFGWNLGGLICRRLGWLSRLRRQQQRCSRCDYALYEYY